jgi:protein TonB
VGGSSQAASLIKKVPPTYPPLAKVQHIQGTVRFAATIEKDGTIDRLRVLSGPALLVPSAMVAVRQWLYRPAMANGNPIEATTQVEVTFTLNQ